MKKEKKKIELMLEEFSEWSVGWYGKDYPIVLELPKEVFESRLDESEQVDFIEDLKSLLLNYFDVDGQIHTKEEIDAINAAYDQELANDYLEEFIKSEGC